jgi:F1F0 ATPase subunit 2
MIRNAEILALVFVVGIALSAFFFGGLWWTTRRGIASSMPAAWFLPSLMLRTGVVVAGFFEVSLGDWQRLLACMLGFLAARTVLIRCASTRSGAPT